MHIPAFSQLLARLRGLLTRDRTKLTVIWTIKERDSRTGDYHTKVKRKNLFTNYGLTALASAIGGGYSPPAYLVISQTNAPVYQQANPGDTSIYLNANPTISGDTQIVVGAGQSNQEVLTFTSVSGTGPYIFVLSSPVVNTHPVGDPATRQVNANDTMAQMTNEAQYDPTYNANMRMYRAAGYSGGVGNYTMQFYFSGTTLTNVYAMTVGLTDQQNMTSVNANLHNAVVLGYNHNNTNDVEIDVSFTITNS